MEGCRWDVATSGNNAKLENPEIFSHLKNQRRDQKINFQKVFLLSQKIIIINDYKKILDH
jgi:hypothetical protein